MVREKSQYRYSRGLDSIKIDGGIMPLRDDDQKNDMRGEDIAFCGEAADEICDGLKAGWGELPFLHVDMTDTRVLAKRPHDIAQRFADLNDRGKNGDVFFCKVDGVGDAMNIYSGDTPPPSDFFTSHGHEHLFSSIKQDIALKSNPEVFKAGEKCRQSHIEDLIEDSQQFKSSIRYQWVAGVVDSVIDREAWGTFDPGDVPSGEDYLYQSFFAGSSPDALEPWAGGYVTRYTSAMLEVPPTTVALELIRAYAVVMTEVQRQDDRYQWSHHYYLDMIEQDLAIDDAGRYRRSAADLIGRMAALRAAHGIVDLPRQPSAQWTRQEVRQSYWNGWLQFVRGDHTLWQ